MCNTVFGYQELLSHLGSLIHKQCLPHAIAFESAPYTGKLSLSLELARMLQCQERAHIDCNCFSCIRHRSLTAPNLMIIGKKRFILEITYTAYMVKTHKDQESLCYFQRAVRKLLKRFDTYVINPSQIKGLSSVLEHIYEAMRILPHDITEVSRIVGYCEKLVSSSVIDVPVATVRHIIEHSHYVSTKTPKVLIIENIHTLSESSASALLKLLEETPDNFYIICTMIQRYSVLHPLISRMQLFSLPLLHEHVRTKLFQQALKISHAYDSVHELFLTHYYGHSFKEVSTLFVRCMHTSFQDFFSKYTELIENNLDIFFDILEYSIPLFSKKLADMDIKHIIRMKKKWIRLINMRTHAQKQRVNIIVLSKMLMQSEEVY